MNSEIKARLGSGVLVGVFGKYLCHTPFLKMVIYSLLILFLPCAINAILIAASNQSQIS